MLNELEEARLFAVNLHDLYQCEGIEHYLGHYDQYTLEEMALAEKEANDQDSDSDSESSPKKKSKKANGGKGPKTEAAEAADGKKPEECK